MARVLQPKDRDVTAERLLDSSMRNSYDPDVDVDWDAPLVEGKGFLPEERVSLYGTALWDRLTPEQRLELAKHEIGSITSVGLWTEIVLMQLLARYAADLDPRSPHMHYALTEIGDETRHAIMFGKGLTKLGLPAYGPPRAVRLPAKVFGAVIGGPAMFASVLVVEETTDRLQRSMLDDESIQPMIRMINRIHVVEEARHVRYAREELVRGVAKLRGPALELHRLVTAVVAHTVVNVIVHPAVYRSVGLDPREARAVAQANPYHHETRRWMGEKIVAFLSDVGMIGGPSKRIWRKAHLL
ncbi:AurF N-oxygenase family protein [Actinophytocola oryzae]|uniref:Para-aminobenzoate N-oxygenase AurF n=1 Tax=Actinophytocola oryzae TaxID=502181 RepID=A0A4R7VMX6_9PSEU|nr:diiron oxygenase [Actinophytocola oryzae]TDV50976.1 para-aminobenzoate N-oxygenase AurF [Actinophytocola oryzae]